MCSTGASSAQSEYATHCISARSLGARVVWAGHAAFAQTHKGKPCRHVHVRLGAARASDAERSVPQPLLCRRKDTCACCCRSRQGTSCAAWLGPSLHANLESRVPGDFWPSYCSWYSELCSKCIF